MEPPSDHRARLTIGERAADFIADKAAVSRTQSELLTPGHLVGSLSSHQMANSPQEGRGRGRGS
jgi:hypothetical protein